MVGLAFAGDALVHGVLVSVGILLGLFFYAYEMHRLGLDDPRVLAVVSFAVAFGARIRRVKSQAKSPQLIAGVTG